MKNRSSWIRTSILIIILICVIFFQKHQDIFYVKKAHSCFKTNNIACVQKNLEKAFALGVKTFPEREMYLNTIINAPFDIKAQEKLLNFKNLNVEDELSLRADYFIHDFRKAINNKYSDNYIMQAVLNQKIVRWGQMPISYYFEPTNEDLPKYYKEEIEKAFSEWSKVTDFRLTFAEGNEKSNIKIKFNSHNPADSDDKKYIVAYTTPNIVNKVLKEMSINFYTKDPFDKYYSQNQVYNTALHEIAHALGVMGHSNNKANIMYLTRDDNGTADDVRAEININDINTMKLLYKLKPNITDVFDKESEYLPYLILGDTEDVINAKIREAQFYIRRNPQMPNGYMDLAEAYVDMGEYSKAIKCLEKAFDFANTKTIQEMLNFNIAICHLHLENYVLAEEFIKRSLDINESEKSRYLLAHIYIGSNRNNEALNELKTLSERYPKNIEYAICLTNVYLKEKKYIKARSVLKNYIKNNPEEKGNPRFEAYGLLKIWL